MDIIKVNKILSHTTIVFAGMFLVFFLIDRVNPAMEFISSEISKWVLLLFVISAPLQGVTTLMDIRYREKAAISPAAKCPAPRAQCRHTKSTARLP